MSWPMSRLVEFDFQYGATINKNGVKLHRIFQINFTEKPANNTNMTSI